MTIRLEWCPVSLLARVVESVSCIIYSTLFTISGKEKKQEIHMHTHTHIVLLRFQICCRRSVSVGFARKTAVFGSVSVLIIRIVNFFMPMVIWYDNFQHTYTLNISL